MSGTCPVSHSQMGTWDTRAQEGGPGLKVLGPPLRPLHLQRPLHRAGPTTWYREALQVGGPRL